MIKLPLNWSYLVQKIKKRKPDKVLKIQDKEKKHIQRVQSKRFKSYQKCEVAQLTGQINQNKRIDQKPSLMSLMEQFLIDRKQQFDMLEKAYQENNEANIKVITNSLRFKYGIAGQGRQMAINKLCDMLVELLLPMHMRYLFWVASEDLDIFNRERQSGEFQSNDMSDSQLNCLNSFGLDDEQILKIQNMQSSIQEQRQYYDNLILEIFKIQNWITKESQKCQQIADEIWDILEPKQAAGLLISLDKNRTEQFKEKKVYPDCVLLTLQKKAKQQIQRKQSTYFEMKRQNKQEELEMQNYFQQDFIN
ncbi:unnamed protein product [Paramecium sonneborni]|uniref:Uncharacterized protein n=1 Tax=Paramecium sonneborni TaxID=65129 RepID=A0A8S1L3M4_9CILI|nr:unnamed protein product [Paramecium sonneborni]